MDKQEYYFIDESFGLSKPLSIGMINPGIQSLSLPWFNNIIEIGSIPPSIRKLSFKVLNTEFEYGAIPDSVTDLDLGDEFDIQNKFVGKSYNFISTLRCSFKFINSINQACIPSSVTDLRLYNYNNEIELDSIPSTVVYLTLGSKFSHFGSLLNLPSSITKLEFGIDVNLINQTNLNIIKEIRSKLSINLKINSKNLDDYLVILDDITTMNGLLIHNESEWEMIEELVTCHEYKFLKLKKLNGILNGRQVNYCIVKKVIGNHFEVAEIKMLKQFNGNKYSIDYYGTGFDAIGDYYIYMEFIENAISIKEKLEKLPNNRFDTDDLMLLAFEITIALKVLHESGIAHGYIKCSNILLIEDDNGKRIGIKLIDFGFYGTYRFKALPYNSFFEYPHRFEAPGATYGTFSLESDIFSLGCTFSEMGGKILNKNGIAIHDHFNYKFISPIIPYHLPPKLKYLIEKCIVYNPDGRPSLENLLELLSNGGISFDYELSHEDHIELSTLNEPLKVGMIKRGIKSVSLPSFNNIIEIGSIPSTVTNLSFKIFNTEFECDAIPDSVTDLDLGDEFDIQLNGDNIPGYTIIKLSCGFKYTKPINFQKHIPNSVTNLQLNNYNIKLNKKSIPSSVTSLTLGSNFTELESLSNLPTSIINLTLGIDKSVNPEVKDYLPKTILSFIDINNNIGLPKNIIPSQFIDLIPNIPSRIKSLSIDSNINDLKSFSGISVKSLTLGPNFTNIEILSYLPSSLICLNLNFDILMDPTNLNIVKESLYKLLNRSTLTINGIQISTLIFLIENSNFNNITTSIENLLIHNETEWEMIKLLGKGGCGEVSKLKKLNGELNGKPVDCCAVKKIEKEFKIAEINILKQFNGNKYSINYYGIGIDAKGNYYIYMEFIENAISIKEKLKTLPNNRFDGDEFRSLALEITTALNIIHESGVAHRDIKGDNILLIEDDNGKRIGIKLIDFGFSKQFDKSTIVQLSTVVGTITHWAPEVCLNLNYSLKADIFSLGCTFIEMAGGNLIDKIKGIPSVPDHLPQNFINLILRCITYNPHARSTFENLFEILSGGELVPFDSNFRLLPKDHIELSISNEPLTTGMINKGIKSVSLPLFNNIIKIGSIPSTVTNLSFKVFNKEFEFDAIPSSVKYLDLGDEFDIQLNSDNIPIDSILTLRCGFKFIKPIHYRSIPQSVTDLQLNNYNIQLLKTSIPSSVTSLTLGSNFSNIASLSNLPSSINNLTLGIDKSVNPEVKDLLPKTVTFKNTNCNN